MRYIMHKRTSVNPDFQLQQQSTKSHFNQSKAQLRVQIIQLEVCFTALPCDWNCSAMIGPETQKPLPLEELKKIKLAMGEMKRTSASAAKEMRQKMTFHNGVAVGWGGFGVCVKASVPIWFGIHI